MQTPRFWAKTFLFSGSGVGTVICILNKDPRWNSLIWECFLLGNKCSFACEVTSIGILHSANVGTSTPHDVRCQKRDEIDIFLFHNIIGLEGFLLLALVWVLALELRRERSKAPRRLQPGEEAESLPSRADDEYHRRAVCRTASFNSFLSCDVTSLPHHQTFNKMLCTAWLCVGGALGDEENFPVKH